MTARGDTDEGLSSITISSTFDKVSKRMSWYEYVYAQELEVLSLSHLYSLKTKIAQCHYVVMTRSETKFQAPLNRRYQEVFGEK